MNKARRGELQKALDKLAEVRDMVEQVKTDEEGAKDNLSESLQMGDKASAMDEACNGLEYALDQIDEAGSNIEQAMGR
jgi:hypothetical protein